MCPHPQLLDIHPTNEGDLDPEISINDALRVMFWQAFHAHVFSYLVYLGQDVKDVVWPVDLIEQCIDLHSNFLIQNPTVFDNLEGYLNALIEELQLVSQFGFYYYQSNWRYQFDPPKFRNDQYNLCVAIVVPLIDSESN